MTRVLIVDDHAVVRAGLRMLVGAEEDMERSARPGRCARPCCGGSLDRAPSRPMDRLATRAELVSHALANGLLG